MLSPNSHHDLFRNNERRTTIIKTPTERLPKTRLIQCVEKLSCEYMEAYLPENVIDFSLLFPTFINANPSFPIRFKTMDPCFIPAML